MNSSLGECMNCDESISHKQLYRISDLLYERKDQIDKLLYNRITSMFDLEDQLVIYDIINTYFETRKQNSQIAIYGRSKEKRYYCLIVVFTGVINAEGSIRHSCILAYQLVNTIRFMLKQANIHHDWQNIMRIMSTQTLQSINMPTDSKVVCLRKPTKPIQQVSEIYKAARCKHTQKKVKKYVVYH